VFIIIINDFVQTNEKEEERERDETENEEMKGLKIRLGIYFCTISAFSKQVQLLLYRCCCAD
jgi:hypothetical protein